MSWPYPHISSGRAGTSPGDASFDIPVPALADPHQAADWEAHWEGVWVLNGLQVPWLWNKKATGEKDEDEDGWGWGWRYRERGSDRQRERERERSRDREIEKDRQTVRQAGYRDRQTDKKDRYDLTGLPQFVFFFHQAHDVWFHASLAEIVHPKLTFSPQILVNWCILRYLERSQGDRTETDRGQRQTTGSRGR